MTMCHPRMLFRTASENNPLQCKSTKTLFLPLRRPQWKQRTMWKLFLMNTTSLLIHWLVMKSTRMVMLPGSYLMPLS